MSNSNLAHSEQKSPSPRRLGSLQKLQPNLAVAFALVLAIVTVRLFAVDQDQNALSDVWEEHYNLVAPNNNAGDDKDSDGFTNAQEADAGTDPDSSSSKPVITSTYYWYDDDEEEDWVFKAWWWGEKGVRYDPEYRQSSVWYDFGLDVTGNNGNAYSEDTVGTPEPSETRLNYLAPLDSDNDNLNAWEEFRLGTSDSDSDSDDDGFRDDMEYIQGMDPTVASVVDLTDFESDWGSWSNVTGDDYDWTRDNNGTPSSSTGPSIDHTLGTSSGYYAFMETSSGQGAYVDGDEDYLESSTYDADTVNFGLSFYYHMYGSEIGTLNVDVYANGNWTNSVWSISGQQHTSSSQSFTHAAIDLTDFTGQINLRFRGEAAGGYRGDMAIDDLYVYNVNSSANADTDALTDPEEYALGTDTGEDATDVASTNSNIELEILAPIP